MAQRAPFAFETDLVGDGAGGAELKQLRWGFPRDKGGPIINFRSEGRRFPNGRCLVPASHFFEFTGTKYPKTKWRFTKTGDLLMPCHEYCGLGHSQMIATVRVVPPERFLPDAQGRVGCGDDR